MSPVTRVLVPIDGSEMAERALEYAVEEHPDATLHLLHATDFGAAGYTGTPGAPAEVSSEEWSEVAEEQAKTILETARQRAEELDQGVTVATEMEVGEPARSIVETAERKEVDHIVIGSHGREGLSRVLLGSVAETVVRRSPVPVTVVR